MHFCSGAAMVRHMRVCSRVQLSAAPALSNGGRLTRVGSEPVSGVRRVMGAVHRVSVPPSITALHYGSGSSTAPIVSAFAQGPSVMVSHFDSRRGHNRPSRMSVCARHGPRELTGGDSVYFRREPDDNSQMTASAPVKSAERVC
jgi:hypothetical protein